MTRAASALLTAALVWAVFSWDAAAQTPGSPSDSIRGPGVDLFCGDHAQITGRLGKTYGESRIGIGLLDDGRVVEIFTAPRGTWSLLVTEAGGSTCLVASGEGWQGVPPDPRIKSGGKNGFAI